MHGQEGDDELRRALQQDAGQPLGTQTQRPQPARQPLGPGIQLGIRQAHDSRPVQHGRDQGHALRGPRHLRGEELVQPHVGPGGPPGVVETGQELLLLRPVQQREVRQGAPWIFHRPRQKAREMTAEPLDRRALEQVPAVLEHSGEAALRLRPILHQGARQLELRRPRRHLSRGERQPRQHERSRRRVLQREEHLHQRRTTQVPLRRDQVDQALERHLLVGVGRQRRLPHPREERHEVRRPREIRAQHQRVDEEADQRLRLHPGAPRDRCPHRQVVRSRIALQQRRETRQQGHEQRRPALPGEADEPGEPLLVDREAGEGPPRSADSRTRMIRRQVERRRHPRELALPPGELRLQKFSRQPPALPGGVVRVLDAQLRQRAGEPLPECRIERRQLAGQHPDRPAVARDVVQRHQRDVLLRRQGQKRGAQQRARRQIEGEPRALLRQPRRCLCP